MAGVDGVRVWRAAPGDETRFRVTLDAPTDAPDDARVASAWEAMRGANPRLYDAPFLSVRRFDADGPTLACAPDRYKRLAVRAALGAAMPGPAPDLASVIGVLLARDADGGACALLGRRSPRTRIFGGLWEFAPAGGIDPDLGPGPLDAEALVGQVRRELPAETGLAADLPLGPARLLGVIATPGAHSHDVVLALDTGAETSALDALAGARSWEYEALRWLREADADEFDGVEAAGCTPQCRAVLRLLGWVA